MSYGLEMRNPPYVHDKDTQYQDFMGTTNGQNYNKAILNLQYNIQSIEVYHDDGVWKVDYNNGDGASNIAVAWFDPPFPVRNFSCYVDADTNFMQLLYDTPFSEKVIFPYATGVKIQEQITRLWLADASMTKGKILLSR